MGLTFVFLRVADFPCRLCEIFLGHIFPGARSQHENIVTSSYSPIVTDGEHSTLGDHIP